MAEAAAVESTPEPSLRDTIDTAIEEVTVAETPPVEATPDEPSPAPAEAAPEEVKTEPVEAKPAEEPVDEIPVLGDKPADRPPASWKGDAKKVWGELPESARNEVVRRERQVDQVLKESADARQNVEAISAVASRYAERINEWGVPIPQVLNNLLEADRILSSAPVVDKARYMAQLIKEYGVDIAALDSALSGKVLQEELASADVTAQVRQLLQKELAPIRERIAADQREQQQQIDHTIESMAADHEKFPYFQDVRDDMADLIEIRAKRGVYLSLEQAYSITTGGNPTVAASNQALRQRTAALEADATARKAKNAATSIGGSPASVHGGADPTDLRASISAAVDGARV